MKTEHILNERQKTHGDFTQASETHYKAKALFRPVMEKNEVPLHRIEAIEAIIAKMNRIAHGDHNHADHWDDIAGYAMLGKKESTSNNSIEKCECGHSGTIKYEIGPDGIGRAICLDCVKTVAKDIFPTFEKPKKQCDNVENNKLAMFICKCEKCVKVQDGLNCVGKVGKKSTGENVLYNRACNHTEGIGNINNCKICTPKEQNKEFFYRCNTCSGYVPEEEGMFYGDYSINNHSLTLIACMACWDKMELWEKCADTSITKHM